MWYIYSNQWSLQKWLIQERCGVTRITRHEVWEASDSNMFTPNLMKMTEMLQEEKDKKGRNKQKKNYRFTISNFLFIHGKKKINQLDIVIQLARKFTAFVHCRLQKIASPDTIPGYLNPKYYLLVSVTKICRNFVKIRR
jgi:hypothetical protein